MGTILSLVVGIAAGVLVGREAYEIGFSWGTAMVLGWIVLMAITSSSLGHKHKGGDQ